MNRNWTLKQEQLLKELFPYTETKVIAEKIGKSCSSVYCKSANLKLKRTPEFIEKQQKMFADTLRREGAKTRFKKGAVPHSKGKKREEYMSAEGIEKVKATEFKKGQIPHNWVPIGSERLGKDGYVMVKIKDNFGADSAKNYAFKHRIIWEQHFGKIPKNVNVEFIDGNILNFDISNLVLRTKTENLINNMQSDKSIAKRFFNAKTQDDVDFVLQKAPELIKVKKTQMKINHLIKQHGR